jgi:protein required for attachment to host cells
MIVGCADVWSFSKLGDMMLLPHGTIIAVADGERLSLFRNTGDERHLALAAMPQPHVDSASKGVGGGHHRGSASSSEGHSVEDGFAGAVVGLLNRRVLEGAISALVIVAAPHTLGELRKSYHKKLSEVLHGEIAKDLAGHAVHDVEKAIAAA